MAAVKLAPASGKVTGTHNNIPLLVIPSAVTNIGALTAAEANSVRFYADSAYVVELAREVVGANEIHYKTGSSYSSSSESWMDWDGVRADYGVATTYGRNAVWSDYSLVSHNGGGSDSTGNGNTGTGSGGVTIGGASGKIGDATNFDGTNDLIRIAHSSTINVGGNTNSFTVSLWFKTSRNTEQFMIGKYDAAAASNVDKLPFLNSSNSSADGRTRYGYRGTDATFRLILADDIDYTNNAWQYMVTQRDSSANTVRIIMNDIENNSQASSLGSQTMENGCAIVVGAVDNDGSVGSYYLGDIDEIRLHQSVTSADWHTTEYQNQNDNSAFWVATPVASGFTPTPLIHMQLMAGGLM